MIKMKLNNSVEFAISGYNRYTDITEGQVSSNASVSLNSAEAYNDIVEIAASTITDIRIEKDGTVIYNLTNQSAKISNINESLYDDGVVNLSFSIQFNPSNQVE